MLRLVLTPAGNGEVGNVTQYDMTMLSIYYLCYSPLPYQTQPNPFSNASAELLQFLCIFSLNKTFTQHCAMHVLAPSKQIKLINAVRLVEYQNSLPSAAKHSPFKTNTHQTDKRHEERKRFSANVTIISFCHSTPRPLSLYLHNILLSIPFDFFLLLTINPASILTSDNILDEALNTFNHVK